MRDRTALSTTVAQNRVTMSERDEVLQKIYTLMDEQVRALRSDLNAHEVLEYGERKRQIAALLEKLSFLKDGT